MNMNLPINQQNIDNLPESIADIGEPTGEKCPECKTGDLYRYPVAEGYDDYYWEIGCVSCGFYKN